MLLMYEQIKTLNIAFESLYGIQGLIWGRVCVCACNLMFETLCCFDSVAMNFKFSSVFMQYMASEISLSRSIFLKQ